MLARVVLTLAVAIAGISRASDLSEHSVPFRIEASGNVAGRFPGAPRIHSFAWAQWDGKWIFIAGRTGGYHGVGGSEVDFPRSTANVRIWVVDPNGDGPARTFSFPLDALPASLEPVKDQWSSSNPAFFQDGEILYIAGGYGKNSGGAWVTYPILSSVRLSELVEGIIQHRNTLSSSIHYTESSLVQVAGGELLKLDDGAFYLVGGHVFNGTYSEFESTNEQNTVHASQQYTGEIRKLRFAENEGRLSVELLKTFSSPEFARRDLNAAYRILPDGHTLGAAAYGGVFTKDQAGFTQPIYWDSSSPPTPETQFNQRMSGYTCAHLQIFDPDSHTMYTTFFGGISAWSWNFTSHRAEPAPLTGDKSDAVYFDGLTWIDHVTTLAQAGGNSWETVQDSTRLPGYLGTNAVFIPTQGLPRIRPDADVLDMNALRGKHTLVGYVYGGIRAYPKQFPYDDMASPYRSGSVPTKASDVIVPVYVTIPGK